MACFDIKFRDDVKHNGVGVSKLLSESMQYGPLRTEMKCVPRQLSVLHLKNQGVFLVECWIVHHDTLTTNQ